MPKRKANWWPASILSDPDVLSVDDEGRFVLCKICHVHYAVHGGKKPKPVIMNSNFRTRAWDVHKERTNSHRLQKQQKLQQAKIQTQAENQPQTQAQGQQIQQNQPHSQGKSQSQSQGHVHTQLPLTQPQTQQSQSHTSQTEVHTQTQQQLRQPHHQQQQRQRQRKLEEVKDAVNEQQQQIPAPGIAKELPTSDAEITTTTTVSGEGSITSHGGVSIGKRPTLEVPHSALIPRRRVLRAGPPGSSKHFVAEAEAPRRINAPPSERHSFMQLDANNHARRTQPTTEHGATEHGASMQQAESSARWRHMHDDVSRALHAPRRRQQTYTSGELHAAKTLVQTESGTFGGNENAKVAKKLRSLNDEYHASNMRHADAYNMRHADAYNMRHPEVFDRRSAGYKEYWGTLRDVYTSSGSFGTTATCRKSHHRHGTATTKPVPNANKEAEADSTTPDDSGSSDDAFKPTVIVHDATLLGAIERLTDATTKQIASLYAKETLDTREELRGLTSVMTDLRVQHGHAFGRIIELQEKHLKVMEGILEVKLRKEAARNANSSNSANSANINTGNNTNKDRQGEDKRPSQNGEKAHPSAA